MPSDILWALRFTSSEYVMRTRGNEKYLCHIIESKFFWSTVMISNLYENSKLGVVVKMVIEEEHGFLFGTYVE